MFPYQHQWLGRYMIWRIFRSINNVAEVVVKTIHGCIFQKNYLGTLPPAL